VNDKAKSNLGLLRIAWQATGGWRGVFHGPDPWLVGVLWCLTYPFWIASGWWSQVLSVLPNVLGFTLGGFAIFLGFGSDSFRSFLVEGKNLDRTQYVSVSGSFLVFSTVQLVAIAYALVVNALQVPPPAFLDPYADLIAVGNKISGGIGYLFFIYSLVLALRIALRLFRLSRWYAGFLRSPGLDLRGRAKLRRKRRQKIRGHDRSASSHE
jgi:hypothetical protein